MDKILASFGIGSLLDELVMCTIFGSGQTPQYAERRIAAFAPTEYSARLATGALLQQLYQSLLGVNLDHASCWLSRRILGDPAVRGIPSGASTYALADDRKLHRY